MIDYYFHLACFVIQWEIILSLGWTIAREAMGEGDDRNTITSYRPMA